MEKNNNDRKNIAITLSLKFKEMAASFDAMSKSLADFKASMQLIEDIAKRQELEDKAECSQLSLGIGPISLADMETSENQLSGPKMWVPPTIHLPVYDTEQPQTLAELEARARVIVNNFGADDRLERGPVVKRFIVDDDGALVKIYDVNIDKLELYLLRSFGWSEETNYMTVDAPDTRNVCYIKQWLDMPVIRVGSWANKNHNADGLLTGCIDGRLLENIDWKDCLFTRTTDETDEQ